MTYAEFASYIRFMTHTDANTFTDANIMLLANTYKDKMAVAILGANENYFGLPYLQNLVAAQREYPLTDTVAGQFKFVEAMLNGTDWSRLYETDYNLEQFITTEAGIQAAYQGRRAEFAIFRNSLWLLSDSAIINVTNGLKIWAYIWPANITGLSSSTEMSVAPSSTTHGWPRQFQELLARRVIVAYKESRDKPIMLTESEKSWKNDFYEVLEQIMHPNLDRSIVARIPYDDGSEY